MRIPQETQAEEISNKLSNLKKEEKNRAKKIQEVEKTVQTLQADLEKPVKVENMADVDEEIVRLYHFLDLYLSNFGIASSKSRPQPHG
jgi:hypothetical protein